MEMDGLLFFLFINEMDKLGIKNVYLVFLYVLCMLKFIIFDCVAFFIILWSKMERCWSKTQMILGTTRSSQTSSDKEKSSVVNREKNVFGFAFVFFFEAKDGFPVEMVLVFILYNFVVADTDTDTDIFVGSGTDADFEMASVHTPSSHPKSS